MDDMTVNARILLACVDAGAAQALTDRLHGLGHTVCSAGQDGFTPGTWIPIWR